MRPRAPFAALAAAVVSTVITGLSGPPMAGAQAAPPPSSVGSDPLVRLSGEFVRTAVERPDAPAATAVRVGQLFVPVSGDELAQVPDRAQVTVDVRVPDVVTEAAAAEEPTTIRGLGGRPHRHELDREDLRAASDATPASATSAIGEATRDAAFTPGAQPLTVDTLVTAAATSTTSTSTTRQITYVEVTPRGLARTPVAAETARQQVAAADAYWSENSGGAVRIGAPSIRTPIASAYACSQDPFSMWSEVVQRTGWTWTDNASLVIVLPPAAEQSCGYGLGTIGASVTDGGVLHVSGTDHPVLSHELGHNISLGHANVLTCRSGSDATRDKTGAWGTGCTEVEYADALDIMGLSDATSTPMLSSVQAVRSGLLPSTATTRVGYGTTDVTLRPLSALEGTRAAVVTNAATGVRYHVEYRTPTGRDSSNPLGMRTGVRVLRGNPVLGTSVLLDPTPTGWSDRDAVLDPGTRLTSHDGKVTFTTLATSPTEAVVRIANTGTAPFRVVSRPRISGTSAVGYTLSSSTGSWSPTPSSYTYRWKRNGYTITGATSRRYTPTTKDAGRYLTVTVTARRTGSTTTSSTSARVGVPIYATTRPSVTGRARVGRTLSVDVGEWTPRPSSYSYRWYRNSRAISGATSRTYTVRSADRGQQIRARVTARRTGYVTGARWTATRTIAS